MVRRKNRSRKIKRKKGGSSVFRGLLFLVGLSLCLYPMFSGLYANQKQREILATYEANMKKKSDIKQVLEKARNYNQKFEQKNQDYEKQLNLTNDGIMGTIQIPKIQVDLPIWHGTEKEALLNGVGHLRESSLPVGGESTRCVLTGHRGLPNARMFTRLDELKAGDLFFLKVCGETLAYQVYGTEVIVPEDLDSLRIMDGRDIVSLVTCTPYGINTHRLIVNGERIAYDEKIYSGIQMEAFSIREQGYFLILIVLTVMTAFRLLRRKRK